MAEQALQSPFSSKLSVSELSDWLVENGIPVEVSMSFEDHAIDGESFLELTEQDIKDLVPKIGHIKKVLKLSKLVGGFMYFFLCVKVKDNFGNLAAGNFAGNLPIRFRLIGV
jgi:hypothetical protein